MGCNATLRLDLDKLRDHGREGHLNDTQDKSLTRDAVRQNRRVGKLVASVSAPSVSVAVEGDVGPRPVCLFTG